MADNIAPTGQNRPEDVEHDRRKRDEAALSPISALFLVSPPRPEKGV
ncbi:MAG TPA: hypothetical protein VJV39_02995 [Dongiaceae bacterium]|nr:hypothetical protein [Dongiaceae bacterium]